MKFLKVISLIIFISFSAIACGSSNDEANNENDVGLGIDQMAKVVGDGGQHFENLLQAGSSSDDAINKTMEWLKTKDGFIDVHLSKDGLSIFTEDLNGITSVLTFYELKYVSSINQSLLYDSSGISCEISTNQIKAAVLDPLVTEYGSKMTAFLCSKGVSVKAFRGAEFTPLTFFSLSKYDLIYYVGHASEDDKRAKLHTGVPYSKSNIDKYEDLMRDEKFEPITSGDHLYLGLFNTTVHGQFISISNYFIEDILKGSDRGLKATVVYVDGCHSSTEKLVKAFTDSGAKSYLGWTGGVFAGGLNEIDPIGDWIYEYLFNIFPYAQDFFDNLIDCKSIKDSYDLTMDSNSSFNAAELELKPDNYLDTLILPMCELGIPQNLAITIQNDTASIIWDEVGYADSYRIYVDSSPGVGIEDYANLYESTTNSFELTLIPGQISYFVITAINNFSESLASAEDFAFIDIGTISGHVTISNNGGPLPDATVRLDIPGSSIEVKTDSNGYYSLNIPTLGDYFLVSVGKNGYVPKTANIAKSEVLSSGSVTKDFELNVAPENVLILEIVPELHHLGDNRFNGAVNSQFQQVSEGLIFTKIFVTNDNQLPPNYTTAEIHIISKGVQGNDEVYVNDVLVAYLVNSPSDGSFALSVLPIDISILLSGENTLKITSIEVNTFDDFEFANVLIYLYP